MIFKQAFRIAFVTLIWKQYRAIIVSTILLIVYLILVKNIHADILLANTQSGTTSNLGASIVYKWLAYSVGVCIYFIFHIVHSLRPNKKTLKNKAKQANDEAINDENDPFAEIRDRKKLRSKADFIEGKE